MTMSFSKVEHIGQWIGIEDNWIEGGIAQFIGWADESQT